MTYLGSLKQVDSDKLLNVGICAGSLAVLYEGFQDPRVKAIGIIVPSIAGSGLAHGTFLPAMWNYYVIGGVTKLFQMIGINPKAQAIPDEEGLKNAEPLMKAVANYYPEGKIGSHRR